MKLGFPVALLVAFCLARVASAAPPSRAAAEQLWDAGQDAVEEGNLADAQRYYEASLVADPNLARNHLSLAAIRIGRDDLGGACRHLEHYLDACPEQRLVRVRYADLLIRDRQRGKARAQFERCIADIQEHGGPAASQLIHCHRRLMEIAEYENDAYGEHLHRGVGLYHLARERVNLPAREGLLPAEGLFFKAAAALTRARSEREYEARPCWYLYEVWTGLGQRQAAQRWLRAADTAAAFSHLTPAEQRRLAMTRQMGDTTGKR